jgi:ADP-heptose:LPS heptosyltransferase
VERAVAKAGPGIAVWDGSFAGFAEHIARSRVYVGYDSAGGHVASACGIPLVSIFAGFASERMLQRWSPPGAHVLRADDYDVAHALVRAASTLVSTLGATSS